MNFIKKIIAKLDKTTSKIIELLNFFDNINQRFDNTNINQGIILANLNLSKNSKEIQEYEFKVFSQRGKDGIIQYLINAIEIKNKTFIEFGIEDFFESNCRFF